MSFKATDEVSLNTIKGRIRMPVTLGKYGEIPFNRMSGQCDLVRRNKIFYLMVSVDIPEQPSIEPKNVIGVDMGIANISVDSTGKYYSGRSININIMPLSFTEFLLFNNIKITERNAFPVA